MNLQLEELGVLRVYLGQFSGGVVERMTNTYETETFTLIDKKSIKVESVMDFSWSPTDSILALCVPELGGGNQPARASLVQIPSKEELRQKNLFSVSDCKMYWQSNGDYLAVKVDRYTKTMKSTYTGFELFRIEERDIPIEVLELDNKNDQIIAFAWEPKGHRFAVIHGDNPRPDVSFYSMRTLITLVGFQNSQLSRASRQILFTGHQLVVFLYWLGLKVSMGSWSSTTLMSLKPWQQLSISWLQILNGIPLEGMLQHQ